MFRPLPPGFHQLEAMVAGLGEATFLPPPEVQEIGRRLREVYAPAASDNYSGLRSRELRQLPFAYWVDGEPPLPVVHPRLVQKYWRHELPYALGESERRSKRWLSALFYTYCESFSSPDSEFLEYSLRLRQGLDRADGSLGARLRNLNQELQFFNPEEAPQRVARSLFVSSEGDLRHQLQRSLLWPGFAATAMGEAVLSAALSLDKPTRRSEVWRKRVLEWIKFLPAPIEKSHLRIPFANGVLLAFDGAAPSNDAKQALTEFFVTRYGDPRNLKKSEYTWEGVDERAKGVLLGWLAGETLQDFLSVLRETADEIWQYREKFWMAYYRHGYIEEAWLALGKSAHSHVQVMRKHIKPMEYGRIESGALANQSVLLLRMGDLVFVEWSHNGSLRAFKVDSNRAPRLYRSTYRGDDLKSIFSLDFHPVPRAFPQLPHSNSIGGNWQRLARDFIRKHLNINMPDAEIL